MRNPFRKKKVSIEDIDAYYCSLQNEAIYRKLSIEICIDLIANAISSVEFRSYKGNKRQKDNIYYQLNVSPNGKQNSTEFYKRLIHKLYFDNEVLIVSPKNNDSKLFIADSFSRDENAIKGDVFKDVMIDNLILNRKFKEEDVLYLKLSDEKIKGLVDAFYDSYGKLLSSSMNFYKRNNAKRFVLEGDFFRPQTNESQKTADEMMTEQFDPFFKADNAGAVFQLQKDFKLEDFSSNIKPDSRDTRNLIDDIFDVTSSAFHVPNGIFKGDLSGLQDQINSFLIFTIKPLVNLIVDEINLKLFDQDEYLNGDFVKADITNIQITDLSALANSIDKFIGSGTMSVNDASERVGTDTIDEEWANRRYITKNYSEAKAFGDENSNLKGGDNVEKGKRLKI